MQISGIKHRDRTLNLFQPPERPLGNHGHRRTVIGDFVEDLTMTLFRGKRHKTDCTADYCPDISVGDEYLECKAAGRTKQTFIYGGRLKKDQRFSKEHKLTYVVWHHLTDTTTAETVEELERSFLENFVCLYVVPFRYIDTVVQTHCQEEKLNTAYGKRPGTESTYETGYRINLSLLEPWKAVTCLDGVMPTRIG